MRLQNLIALATTLSLLACGGGGGGGGSSGGSGTPIATPTPAPACSSTPVINVTTAAELTSALSNVKACDTIQLAAGTYSGKFVATISGSSTQKITLKGPSNAVLTGPGSGYALHLNGVSYWTLDGFSVTNNPGKGIMLDNSHHNTLKNLTVYNIGDEGVHFRKSSTYNTIQNSTIYNIGLTQPLYGEGVYIGSAKSNWLSVMGSNSTPDASYYNQVLNNHIGPNIGAEAVDVKEGTFYGLIQGNTFEMSGISGENSGDTAVDMKGDNYTVKLNTVTNDPTVANINTGYTGKFKDGFQINKNTVNGITYGGNNTFNQNSVDLNTSGNPSLNPAGYAVYDTTGLSNTICNNNSATHGNGSISNVGLSNCP